MIAIACDHKEAKKHGRTNAGSQRFRCKECGQTWIEDKPLGDMRIDLDKAALALGMLLEGMAIRAVSRLTGLGKNTLCDLILTVGENCQRFLERKVRAVPVKDVQLDELWSFIFLKEKNRIARGYPEDLGDSWCFIAFDRETKLVLTHLAGGRDNTTCWRFLQQLKQATHGHFQLSTDGLRSYTANVPFALGQRVDFAQLIKTYSSTQEVTKYSPAQITSVQRIPVYGNPDHNRISTSHVERMNLSVRMHLRRFTRLTNAHSKSPKHHEAMLAIFFAWYNFCRKHEALKGETPAMAAGLAGEPWRISQLVQRVAPTP